MNKSLHKSIRLWKVATPVMFVNMGFFLSLTQNRSNPTREMLLQPRTLVTVKDLNILGLDISFKIRSYPPRLSIWNSYKKFLTTSLLSESVMFKDAWIVGARLSCLLRTTLIFFKSTRNCIGLNSEYSNRSWNLWRLRIFFYISLCWFKHLCLKSKSHNTITMWLLSRFAFINLWDWKKTSLFWQVLNSAFIAVWAALPFCMIWK